MTPDFLSVLSVREWGSRKEENEERKKMKKKKTQSCETENLFNVHICKLLVCDSSITTQQCLCKFLEP